MDTAALLETNFRLRRARNPRYSLRAFARDIALHHGALSQILSRRRPATPRVIRQLAGTLGFDAMQAEALIAAELERKVVRCLRAQNFRPSVRDLATQSGLSMDAVCIVLQRLLAQRQLSMRSPTCWQLEKQP